MANATHEGLRTRLSVTVVVIVAAVMLPFVLFGAAYIERQSRQEAEAQLVGFSSLVRDLVATHFDGIESAVGRLGDAMQLHFGGRYGRDPVSGELLHEGVPVAGIAGDLYRFGDDVAGSVAAIAVRTPAGYRVLSSTRWGEQAADGELMLPLGREVLGTLETGGRWRGQLEVQGRRYLLELLPVRDAAGATQGALLVGVDIAREFDHLRTRLREFAIGDSGYIFVLDATPGPTYGRFIVHPAQEGTNALQDSDNASRSVVAEILQRGNGVISYGWRNAARGEVESRRKLAAFASHLPLGWVIGASSYDDEFGRSAALVRKVLLGAAALLAASLVVALYCAIGRLVIAPMLRLQRNLRTLSSGNTALVHATDEEALLAGICRVLVTVGGFRLARIEFRDEGGCALHPAAGEGAAASLSAVMAADGAAAAAWPALQAVRDGRIVQLDDGDPAAAALRRALHEADCGALIAFPLRDGERLLGALTIGVGRGRELDAAGRAVLAELADDLAFGIVGQRTARAHRLAEAALHLRERAIEATSDGVLIFESDSDGARVLDANPAAERILGLVRGVLVGGRIDDFGVFGPASLERLVAALASAREALVEVAGQRLDGTPFWCEWAFSPVDTERGKGVVCVIKDVTERTHYLRQLEHQAKYDSLTGLPNRYLLDDRLEQAIVVARRRQRMLAVAFLDLDHFKLVNDNVGHRFGDELLREVSRRLAATLREGDTAARQGGDEFVVLLTDLDDEGDAYRVLSRLQQTLAEPVQIGERAFFVTCSIGVSLYPRDGGDSGTLLKHADIAMYRAKAAGRNTIRFFTAEMNAQVRDRVLLEAALRVAQERDELHLAYQAQIDARSGEVVGVEALLRWTHPELGVISPARFIPLAEETGQIAPIGEWVLRTACRQALAWRTAGLALRVAVNVSARQFRSPDLPAQVAAILDETGLPPALLELELTESMLMGDAEQAEEMLHRLKQIGVTLALDDFGTGYSSFAYLQRFPIDTLKIDQSFVRAMGPGSRAEAIVGAIVAMAHSLGLGVIAEGVETEAQRQALCGFGCDELQGYLFGRPVAADFFETRARADAPG